MTRDEAWWGGGDPDRRAWSCRPTAIALREELGIEPGDAADHVDSGTGLACRSPGRAGEGPQAGGEVLEGMEDRLRRSAGRSYCPTCRLAREATRARRRPEIGGRRSRGAWRPARARALLEPYGGGTSVIGGLSRSLRPSIGGLAGSRPAALTWSSDRRAVRAAAQRLRSGERGRIDAPRVTLGAFPQSFEQATIEAASCRRPGRPRRSRVRRTSLLPTEELMARLGAFDA